MNRKLRMSAVALLSVFLCGCATPSFFSSAMAKNVSNPKGTAISKLKKKSPNSAGQRRMAPLYLTVNAPDGPMPPFRAAVMQARAQDTSRVVVHLENTSLLDDPELLDLVVLETEELLQSFNYTSRNSEIVQCPRKCGEAPADPAPEPEGNGDTVTLAVNAPDGPMPPFRAAVMQLRAQNTSRVVVHLENTSLLDDPELLDLVVLETEELLKSFNYTSRNSEIIKCAASC